MRVSVPLERPWASAAGTLTRRESMLVRAVTRTRQADGWVEGEGWGECAALPWPSYTAEYTDGALAVAEQFFVPRLLALGTHDGRSVAPALAWAQGHNMAKAAFEMALLDAELRGQRRSFASELKRVSTIEGDMAGTVPAGVAIGLGPLNQVLREVEEFVAQGYRRVKLKVDPGREATLVETVRRRWPELVVMVDANGAYADLGAEKAAELLGPLALWSVACVEQPLAPQDLWGHAELARRCPVPICLDESVWSLPALQLALRLGACSVVNIKAGRLGGYLAAVAAHDLCAAGGVPVWCGGMVETGLGRAANTALAALPNFSLPGDISASSRFFGTDIAGPVELSGPGTIAVPGGPGLGVEVNSAALQRFTTRRSWYAAAGALKKSP